jgi:hypothetical protein
MPGLRTMYAPVAAPIKAALSSMSNNDDRFERNDCFAGSDGIFRIFKNMFALSKVHWVAQWQKKKHPSLSAAIMLRMI